MSISHNLYARRLALAIAASVGAASSESASAQRPTANPAPLAQRVMIIGSLSAGDDEAVFTRLADVHVSRDGRIYGLDRGESEIKVFSPAGQFLYKFGRRGAGPGELGSPSVFHIRDSIIVVPAGIERVATFELSGKHRRTYGVRLDSLYAPMFALKGGRVLQHVRSARNATIRTAPNTFFDYVLLRTPKVRTVDTVARIWKLGYFELDRGVAGSLSTRFGASGDWALHGDSLLAVVDGYNGVVTWHVSSADGLREVRRESLGVQGARVTMTDVALEMETKRQQATGMADGAITRRPAPLMRMLNPPSQWSVATRALFSLEGALFVQLADKPTGERVWRVFPLSGASFDVAVPRYFWLTSVRGDRMFGTEFLVDDEVMAVGVYQFRR